MDMERRVNELYRTVTGFDKYSRDVTATMDITGSTPMQLTIDEIISFSYVSDVFASGDGPIGKVSNNELTVELLGKYDLQIQDTLSLTLTEENSGVSCLLCTLFIYDCVYDVSTNITTLTAYDLLYGILSDVPNYGKVFIDTNLYVLIRDIFKQQGIAIELLEIDTALQQYKLPYFFMQKGPLSATLNYLCEAYSIGIYVTPQGKIKVSSFKGKTVSATLSEDIQLISTTMAPMSLRPSTQYDVSYSTYHVVSGKVLVDTKLTRVNGTIKIENIDLAEPMAKLDNVQIVSDTLVELIDIIYDQYTISLTIKLASESDIRVIVVGDIIETSVVQKLHTATKATMVENPYVFDKTQATALLNMYTRHSNNGSVLSCSARMNPELQNNSAVHVIDHSITGDYLLVGSTFNYDGSLDGTYTLYSQEVYDGV